MNQTTEHNVETGEIIVRDLTPEEIAENLASAEKAQAEKAAREAEAAKKKVLLEKLGITEEEAKLLLS